ncbi:MAG: hypothetical protein ACOVP4_01475 [Bacteriovoracaceae bacterium]
MKKVLIGMLAFGSLSAFSQSYSNVSTAVYRTNVNFAYEMIEICRDSMNCYSYGSACEEFAKHQSKMLSDKSFTVIDTKSEILNINGDCKVTVYFTK